jgi:hypothetical protein
MCSSPPKSEDYSGKSIFTPTTVTLSQTFRLMRAVFFATRQALSVRGMALTRLFLETYFSGIVQDTLSEMRFSAMQLKTSGAGSVRSFNH